ncbi:NAD-dependent epimerase/dehydratase family protein [Desulfosediminicola sp.]|uniref:NAD-dependent epimerase/dehydratase family protein n=1 Tax=Desulfosediminicola sp. TaxID=2886825 RepID=UPI003AF1F40B
MNDSRHVLVTGANGFLGRHLCNLLESQNFKVTRLVHSSNSCADGVIVLDLLERKQMLDLFGDLRPDYIVHLAANKSRSSIDIGFGDSIGRNLAISLNVVESCLNLKALKKIVFVGSCEEYGPIVSPYNEFMQERPVSPYGISKLTVTKTIAALWRSRQLPGLVLRPSIIYGPDQDDDMFIPVLVKTLLMGKEFSMTLGEQLRDFIYVTDVVDAIVKSLLFDKEIEFPIFNIASGVSISICQLATYAANLIHHEASSLLKIGAVPYRINELMDYRVDIDLAKEALGWHPKVPIENGLRRLIENYGSSNNKFS